MWQLKFMFRKLMKMLKLNKPSNPVVVILGATGTGKSKLALEIASKFNGEIINADSMQIYKGLDIVTNKVTSEERATVPHHVLDFLDVNNIFNVVDFRNRTLPIIEKLHKELKLPVIVGGTHYYVESLLWNVLIQSENVCDNDKQNDFSVKTLKDISDRFTYINQKCKEIKLKKSIGQVCEQQVIQNSQVAKDQLKKSSSFDNMKEGKCENLEYKLSNADFTEDFNLKYLNNMDITSEQLLSILHDIDPEIALSYHPNNRRKIIRSLEVWAQTGKQHSEHIKNQCDVVGESDLGGEIRFKNVAILWVICDQETLDKRLDTRVDSMIKDGLLQELSEFHQTYNAPLLEKLYQESTSEQDSILNDHYRKGIFQCIGFKEFHDYLVLNEIQRTSKEGQRRLDEAKEIMKLRTRQYSRRQIKWIRNRFFLRGRKKIPVYTVDGTIPTLWEEKVTGIAEDVVGSLIAGSKPISAPATVDQSETPTKGDKTRHFCEICQRVFIGNYQWEVHLKSMRHRKVLKKRTTEKKSLDNQKSQKLSL